MNLELFAAAYVAFHVAHGIGDYWVQSDWQAQNKSKNPVALWSHAATYTATFVPAMVFLALQTPLPLWKILVSLIAIGIPHGLMDTRRLINWFCEKTKGWKIGEVPAAPIAQTVRFFVTVEMDQKFHYLCLAVVAAWLAG